MSPPYPASQINTQVSIVVTTPYMLTPEVVTHHPRACYFNHILLLNWEIPPSSMKDLADEWAYHSGGGPHGSQGEADQPAEEV